MRKIIDEEVVCFTSAWGDKHLHYLEKLALPSLMQDGNIPACGYQRIGFWAATNGAHNAEQLRRIIETALAPLNVELDLHVTDYGPHQTTSSGIRDAMAFAIYRKTRLLMVPPDTILGNGSVFNMRQYARNKVVTVAAPHLRVNEGPFMGEFDHIWPLSNHRLVELAMKHAHQCLSDSFCDKDQGTEYGGISLCKIKPGVTTVIHYRPTPYLAWFTDSDKSFFNGRDHLGDWDHKWPAHLAGEGRLRIFGSSDLFFAIELTPAGSNTIHVRGGTAWEEHSDLGPHYMRCFVGGIFG